MNFSFIFMRPILCFFRFLIKWSHADATYKKEGLFVNPLQRMELHKENFTQNDQIIYDHIIKDPSVVTHMSTSSLAELCGVSQPALSRFVKGLGYARYQDFRAEIIRLLAQKNEQEEQDKEHLHYFSQLYLLLTEAEQLLTAEYLKELGGYLSKFPRIFASGIGKSRHAAELLEILMRKHRRFAQAVSHDALNELVDYMESDDLLIIFSVSGGEHIMEEALRANGKVMLVSSKPDSRYANQVDKLVVLPHLSSDPEADSVSPVLFDIFVELVTSFLPYNIERISDS